MTTGSIDLFEPKFLLVVDPLPLSFRVEVGGFRNVFSVLFFPVIADKLEFYWNLIGCDFEISSDHGCSAPIYYEGIFSKERKRDVTLLVTLL